MTKNIKLISDKKLIKIPIKDNGEKIVFIKDLIPEIIIKVPKYIECEGNKFVKQTLMVRIGVAKRLKIAQKLLPQGYKILLRCGYRSIKIQKEIYQKTYNKIKCGHPDWSLDKLREETSKFVAPLDIVPPHSTGGAVDISIIGNNGKQLDMGTKIGADMHLEKTMTNSNSVSNIVKMNRKILIKVMEKAGFVNYPTEWWHWSFGDRYWAAVLNKKYSIYKSIEL